MLLLETRAFPAVTAVKFRRHGAGFLLCNAVSESKSVSARGNFQQPFEIIAELSGCASHLGVA